jgi:hypothetical protein
MPSIIQLQYIFTFFFFQKKKKICFIPMKISPDLWNSKDFSKCWWLPWFPAPNNTCLLICNTVYILWNRSIFFTLYWAITPLTALCVLLLMLRKHSAKNTKWESIDSRWAKYYISMTSINLNLAEFDKFHFCESLFWVDLNLCKLKLYSRKPLKGQRHTNL